MPFTKGFRLVSREGLIYVYEQLYHLFMKAETNALNEGDPEHIRFLQPQCARLGAWEILRMKQ